MKIIQLVAIAAIICSPYLVSAQSGMLQTITSAAKTAATRKANETANKTIDKLLDGSLFKKKEGKAKKSEASSNSGEQIRPAVEVTGVTVVSISGIDYAAVVSMAEIIKANKIVTDVQKSFSNGSGSIDIKHTGKTEEILDDLLKNTAGKYEVENLSRNRITLKVKK